jgi:ANTH domain
MADEVQTFKALITVHKVLQEGHPISVKEAQQNVNWIESLARGVSGEGLRGECSTAIVCLARQKCVQLRPQNLPEIAKG